jgi:hypothetical protein
MDVYFADILAHDRRNELVASAAAHRRVRIAVAARRAARRRAA